MSVSAAVFAQDITELAAVGSAHQVREALQAGQIVDARDGDGMTPLLIAAAQYRELEKAGTQKPL
jgi:hypothetical protein